MRADGVTPELRDRVLRRDARCFASRLDFNHVCRDAWGVAHMPYDVQRLTLDHVHDEGGTIGKRAPSDEYHLVAMCAALNIAGPSRRVREAEREYLRRLRGGAL